MAGFKMKAFPLITHTKWSFLMEVEPLKVKISFSGSQSFQLLL